MRPGVPRPWSNDPVIAEKFLCSVIRDDDRTSRNAREIVLSLPEDQRLGAVLGFRLYNRAETMQALADARVFSTGDPAASLAAFESLPSSISTVYKINVAGGLKNIPAISKMVARAVRFGAKNFERRYRALYTAQRIRAVVGSGPFVCYQTTQDLRWILGTYEDEDRWCLLGIGAMRGLARLAGGYQAATWQERDNEQRADVEKLLGFSVDGRGGPKALDELPDRALAILTPLLDEVRAAVIGTGAEGRMNMMELEHNLCEWDKYCRMSSGESKGRRFEPRPVLQ